MTNVEYTSDRVAVVRSQWGYKGTAYGCMNCGFGVIVPIYNYCPNCGAKMGEDVVGKIAPDLVSVVRCKVCKYSINNAKHIDLACKRSYDPDFYCAAGERRDDDA